MGTDIKKEQVLDLEPYALVHDSGFKTNWNSGSEIMILIFKTLEL